MAASGTAVNAAARVWSPFKDLQCIVEAAVHKRQTDAVHDLEVMLKKHKTDFLSLLKNNPKNATHRLAVKKSNTVGLQIHGEQRTQTFPESFIEEAIIISDLFDLNEYAALELLIAGEDNKPDFPGLTRGLVAVLLYYDGRRCLISSLRTLILALEGRTWTLSLPADLTHLTNTYVQTLVEENLTNKILAVLKTMNSTVELDKLQNNRALGSPKHRKQVEDMYVEIQVTCAECLFCLACQRPLRKDDTLQLIAHLKGDDSLQADGSLSPVTLSLLMALLYCFDVSVLEREDAEEITGNMPVFSDPTYIADVHKELRDGSAWKQQGLRAVAQLAWSVLLRQLSQYPLAAGAGEYYEEDEMMMDLAMDGRVFSFLHTAALTTDKLHKEEFYIRRLHGVMTDFIFHMPLKVKEIRNRGDETARILMAHMQEGQEAPASLRRDFEDLLHLLSSMYEKDPLDLDLSLEYWCPPEPVSQHESFHHRPPQRQGQVLVADELTGLLEEKNIQYMKVALYKFVRMSGDLLPASLYVPYINMLTGLANTPQSAVQCYNLLKMNGSTSSTVSWDHIFSSLNQYFSSLRRESPSMGDQSQSYRMMSRVITPQELDGLLGVLQLVRTVCVQSENCRIAMCENQQWSVVMLLFGLVSCSVPPKMKAELLRTLASLARTPEIAATLWQTLEASQILVTVQAGHGKQSGGIRVELDEIESRNEEYMMTRAFLTFLTMLTDTPVPAALGAGLRAPGFDPYLQYVRDDVFLKFAARAYKDPGEKWEVASLCLGIMYKLLREYDIQVEHFTDQVLDSHGGQPVIVNKPAGFNILLHMLKDSRLFQMIMRILDDTMKHLQTYTSTAGQQFLEQASLLCLQLVEESLGKEDQFVAMVRETGSSFLLTPLDRLLLGINPRTGKADYIVTIAKYLMFNSTLAEHTLSAMRILYLVCKSSPVQSDLITLFTENRETNEQLLHGFVECLDTDEAEDDPVPEHEVTQQQSGEVSNSRTRNSTRQHLLKLLINSLDMPAPSLAHYLLGFELRKPVNKTNLQDQGILNSPKTCLHSVLALLSKGVGTTGPKCLHDTPHLAELGYRLVYMLTANNDTSLPTLRYLRTSHDFLYRQLQHVPYEQKNYKQSVGKHQSWLLKTAAVELRVTSLNRQRSHTHRLIKLLLDDYDEDQTSVLQPVGGEDSEYLSMSRAADMTSTFTRTVKGRQYRRRIMSLLDTVTFDQAYPEHLNLEFFDTRLIQQVVGSIEQKDEEGVTYYDIKHLYRILMNELNNVQGTTMAGQRQMITEEIEHILKMVIGRNKVCQSLHGKQQGFDSWRQVVEIILSACPEDLLQGETRQTVLFEILQDLLMKVADDSALPELTAPVSGVILTLMANLRQCFMSRDSDSTEKDGRDAQYMTLLDRSQGVNNTVAWGQGSSTSGSRTLFATSLQMVLKGLIEHILRCSGGQQRVRAKLYGALLYYLQIANKPKVSQAHLQDATSGTIESRLMAASDTEFDQLQKENISTILLYGDTFMDLLCRDACDGLDVGRMLALSVLDCILMMDKFNQWLTFISSKGYLQHLVDGLSADDDKLMSVLAGGVDNLKVLYLYESKLSLLTRVAETAVGASTLLRCGVIDQLAACSFFDMRPDIDRSEGIYHMKEGFLPDPVSRYRHLLFTTLKFCLALLTSLGVENKEAGIQVMQFVVAHGDIFHSILLDQHSSLNLHALQELALTTAVISRASCQEEDQYAEVDSAEIEFRGHKARIQRHMVALLPKYCVSEKITKQLRNLDMQQDEKAELRVEVMQAYLEVATNVTSYCRALVSNSGPNVQYCRVLFWPTLEEAMSRDIHSGGDLPVSRLSPAQLPNLGVVVYQLKQCTNQFVTVYESRKQHLSKLESLSDLSVEDLKQFSGIGAGEKMSSQQRQLLAKKRLCQLIASNYKELQAYSYIIENSLFLLWRHLEYYLIHCVPSDRGQSTLQVQARRQQQIRRLQDAVGISASPADRVGSGDSLTSGLQLDDSRRHVRQQDIDTLKQASVSVLSESLFKKIQEINQTFCKSRSHYGFVEAVIRRIKRLLRLHTAS